MITTNIKTFTANLRMEREQHIPDFLVESIQKICRILGAELHAPGRVPVDTGKFRGSWDITIGSPSEKVLPDAPYYPILGDDQIDRVLSSLSPGEVVYFTNNASGDGGRTSYAEALDNGHSPQAQEIVRPAIQATLVRVKRAA